MNEDASIFHHEDEFAILHEPLSLSEKLRCLHGIVREHLGLLDRIAVASYDAESDMVKTYLSSDDPDCPSVSHYQKRLADSASLKEIASTRMPRVVRDLEIFGDDGAVLEKLKEQGFAGSYTLPMFSGGALVGFVFFNSRRGLVFNEQSIYFLNMVGHLIALMVTAELVQVRTLAASVRTATAFVRSRDFETGAHLERMAHYARLIALGVAKQYCLDAAMIEHIFLFAPLHDIGKIAVGDNILLKPGKLTSAEFDEMKTHTLKGADIIDAMLGNLGFMETPDGAILRNIALYHHEAINGSGYPSGFGGMDIPVEARITAVADIFDALTSHRPYKSAWSNEEAFAELRSLSGSKLDPACVDALEAGAEEILSIQARFAENVSG